MLLSVKRVKGKKSASQAARISTALRLILFALFFVVILALVLGLIFVSAYSENLIRRYKGTTAVYQIGLDDLSDTTTKYVTLENMYRYGYLYICMDDVAQMCDMTCVGDYDSRTYYHVNDPSQAVTFRFGSDNAVINGEGYAMNASMYEEKGKIYVPASFFNHFCSGVDVLVGQTKSGLTKITLCRVSLGAQSDLLGNTVQIYAPIQYNVSHGESLDPMKQSRVFSSAVPVPNIPEPDPNAQQTTIDTQTQTAQQTQQTQPTQQTAPTINTQPNTPSGQSTTTTPDAPPLSNLTGD